MNNISSTNLANCDGLAWKPEEQALHVQVHVTPDRVEVGLVDSRVDSVRLFSGMTPEQQQQLAQDAWSIGLRGIGNAYAQSQQTHLQDVGETLMVGFEDQLAAHIRRQQETMQQILGVFFDPSSGQVTERMNAFVDDQGVLARLLDQYLSSENSVLAQTLAEKVGEHSPLLRMLSPTETEGVVQVLETKLKEVMLTGQTQLQQTLDPMHPGGAMERFLAALRTDLALSQDDREAQLAAALTALDANDEQSLISRLERDTHQARKAVMDAVNPDIPGSPMAVLATRLTQMLTGHAQQQTDKFELQRVRQEKFEISIREAVTRIETQKRVSDVTPVGGFDFQDQMVHAVSALLQSGPYLVEPTGDSVGSIRNARVGDLVIRFTEESAFHGSAVVFEAKRDSSYNVKKALEELDKARKNREADIGVFVMASSHASVGFPSFARYGQDILLTWDDTDPNAIAWLQAATISALALASRKNRSVDEGDLAALTDIEQLLEAEVKRLAQMEVWTQNITRDAGKIGEEIRKGKAKLDLLIRKGRDVLLALEVDVGDLMIERDSPISLSSNSGQQDNG